MPRRLLFYTHAFGGGGAEMVFARLAHAFAEAGDAVTLAADHIGPTAVPAHPRLRPVLLGGGHAGAVRRLATLLRAERPDASFSALGAQNLKHLAAATLAGRRKRCVLGIHGFAAAEPRPLAHLSYRLAPVVCRLAARTICVGDALLDDMTTTWRAPREKLCRIDNPLAEDAGIGGWAPETPPLVLALGRLDPVKRFPDLVAAMAAPVLAGAKLAILGEGSARPAIEAEVSRLGLAGRVALPGHVADPAPWYRRAACLAVSSASESFGLTIAEAFAHGVPVVATDCGGPAEVMAGLGRLVPVGDVAALSAALAEALSAPGDAAPRRVRAQAFALEAVRDAYARLADSLP